MGMNITFDGRLVMTTDHGWVICLARDFSEYDAIQLPGAVTDAAEHCASRAAAYGHTGYGWVRTSSCTGDDGGIYVSSVDTIHKVVWTGERLSLDPADGAWSARYRNGGGDGSGTTPSLMGFGPDEDRFVVIGDGDEVVNITLLWRDEIPDDWEQLPNALSRRIAGIGPANMGDLNRAEIKTEQSITVSGYGAMTVNNEPASLPAGWPTTRARLFCFFLGHKPAYTPYGLHKYEWDPVARQLQEAWVNTEVSSPNSVPFVAQASDQVYTCGTRGGKWTIEALDWSTGESRFHYVVGGSRYNTLGGGVTSTTTATSCTAPSSARSASCGEAGGGGLQRGGARGRAGLAVAAGRRCLGLRGGRLWRCPGAGGRRGLGAAGIPGRRCGLGAALEGGRGRRRGAAVWGFRQLT